MAVLPPKPLAEDDDRACFDCGRASLNQWFQRHAWVNHVSGVSRVTVLADEADGRIVGYVTLSAAQIERAWLPKAQQRNRPIRSPRRCLVNSRLTSVTKGGGMRGRCSSLLCGRRFKRRR